MEKLTEYRAIAREVIDEYARYKPSYGQSDMSAVYDSDRDRYLLVSFGWNGDRPLGNSDRPSALPSIALFELFQKGDRPWLRKRSQGRSTLVEKKG
jgi:XisI protein